MSHERLAQQLEEEFRVFTNSGAATRSSMLPQLLALISSARSANFRNSSHCTKLEETCRHMARLRQPKNYNESASSSYALNDLYRVSEYLREQVNASRS